MSEKKEVTPLGRRDFFKKASLGAGVVGAAAASLSSSGAKAAKPQTSSSGRAGYRETEHVKKFYELARF
jgi:hypothetical protein